MCCGEDMHGHHGRHDFHHGSMSHGMHCCYCGEEMHGLHSGLGVHHSGMMHGCCCGGRRFQSRKEKIENLEEYRESLLNELDGVEEELKSLKNE